MGEVLLWLQGCPPAKSGGGVDSARLGGGRRMCVVGWVSLVGWWGEVFHSTGEIVEILSKC